MNLFARIVRVVPDNGYLGSTMKTTLLALAALTTITTAASAISAQQPAPSQQSRSVQAAYEMRMRLSAAVDRVRVAEEHGKMTPQRSATLRKQLVDAQADMARLTQAQGFTSAAELASYDRLVRLVDQELSDYANGRSYGNDALPSPEVLAFQRSDARLHYRNARIEYDAKGCSFYQGTTRGKVRRVALRDLSGQALCNHR